LSSLGNNAAKRALALFDSIERRERTLYIKNGCPNEVLTGVSNSYKHQKDLDKLADILEHNPHIVLDENDNPMFCKLDMLRYPITTNAELHLKNPGSHKDSPYLTSHKVSKKVRRWPYSSLVPRRSSPSSKMGLIRMFEGRGRSLDRQKFDAQRGRAQHRTTAMNEEKYESPLWVFMPTDRCIKYSEDFDDNVQTPHKNDPRAIKLVAITLIAREPAPKTYPDQVDEYRAKDNSSYSRLDERE